jgi:hypothetical protein
MDDLAGLGKAAEKFFALIESSVGTLYRPRAIREEGKAAAETEAYKVLALANAEVKAAAIKADGQYELEQRAISRIRQQELVKQSNIESIIALAAKETKDSDVNLDADKDWLHYFFENCGSISDKEVQAIWAKVLASGATAEKGPSRKVIDCLRWLNHDLARRFLKFAPRVFYFGGFFADLIEHTNGRSLSWQSAYNAEMLEEIGLLRQNLSKSFEFEFQSLRIRCVELSDRSLQYRKFFEFSGAGRELAAIVCPDIAEYQATQEKIQPDPVKQIAYRFGDRYTDRQSKLDSTLFEVNKRIQLAAIHVVSFLVEIAASVTIEKTINTKVRVKVSVPEGAKREVKEFNTTLSKPVMTIVKKTPKTISMRKYLNGEHGAQLHSSERKFLETLEQYIEQNRKMIC